MTKVLFRTCACLIFVVATATTSCTSQKRALDIPPRYNEVFGVATHNSYFIDRGDGFDFGASGTQELLVDQLLHDHARAIEIDIHSEYADPGVWRVYHTWPSQDFSGRYLTDILEYLRNFQYANPDHDVLNVIIELKNVQPFLPLNEPVNANFDASHTIEQLDATLRAYLGPWLYTPADFLARAPNATKMVDVYAVAGWPWIKDLRGKFIINIIGNWSSAGLDWVTYASGDMRTRVAFPIQSIFKAEEKKQYGFQHTEHAWFSTVLDGKPYWIQSTNGGFPNIWPSPAIDPDARQAALDASVFWQVEDVKGATSTEISNAFLARGGVIRGADAFEYGDQLQRILRGIQFVQTDYPWHVYEDESDVFGTPVDPSRRLRDKSWVYGSYGSPKNYREKGTRFYAHSWPFMTLWRYAYVPDATQRWWEVTVSTTRRGDPTGHVPPFQRRALDIGDGGLFACSLDGRDVAYLRREKRNTSAIPDPFQEAVVLHVIVVQAGVMTMDVRLSAARYGPCYRLGDLNSGDVWGGCVGSLVGMSVENDGAGTHATMYSAGKMLSNGTPEWKLIGRWDFAQPLVLQGLVASGDVLFAGGRTSNVLAKWLPKGPLSFMKFSDLPLADRDDSIWGSIPYVHLKPEDGHFVDLSVP